MKQVFLVLLCGLLILILSGCSGAVGGIYKLDHATADGLRLSPDSYGVNVKIELKDDGAGTATYGGVTLDVTWVEDDDTVTVTGPNGTLEFTKQGKSLILHDEGTMLFFEPKQEKE